MLRSRSCWEAQNLLKSRFCCDIIMPIFLTEMVKLKSCWEAHNLLKSMFCCDMSIFLDRNGETYMKCWEAQNLLKSMFCCDMSNFIWWKWRNLHEMLRSTKSAEKHVLLWHVWWKFVKLTWNAEKHKICWKTCFVVTCLFFWWKWRNLHEMLRSKKHLLKSMFCCDMSNFFDGKNLNYWCLIGEHSRNTQTGTKTYGRFIFLVYIYMTPWKRFFGSFLLCW